jgi:hypothetical protein
MNESPKNQKSRKHDLSDAATAGNVLKCSDLPIEQLSVSNDSEHIIDAKWLRELLLKRCDEPADPRSAWPDPRGIRVRGAHITDTLDLTHMETAVGLELRDCSFDHPILLDGAHLPWLTLTGSRVPALAGAGLQVDGDLLLNEGFQETGRDKDGVIRLRGAHVTGNLDLSGAKLTNEDRARPGR